MQLRPASDNARSCVSFWPRYALVMATATPAALERTATCSVVPELHASQWHFGVSPSSTRQHSGMACASMLNCQRSG